MRKTTRYARTSALPAIAAALALSPTPAFAQEAQPVPTDPAPVSVAPPSPVATDSAPATEAAPAAADATAATPAETTTIKTTKRTTRTARAAVPVKPVVRTVTRTAAATTTAAVRTPAPVAAAKPATTVQTSQSAVTPVVDLNKPATATTTTTTTATAQPAKKKNDTLPIAAGGALAFLALGGAAVAITRRRHDDEEEEWVEDERMADQPAEPALADEPVVAHEQPNIVAPPASAFAWDHQTRSDMPNHVQSDADADDDRKPGESWVERAYRGPSANNPSVSLRTRLKRAAFFEKSERDVAAGVAEPVDMDAGLPETMVEEQERERELA